MPSALKNVTSKRESGDDPSLTRRVGIGKFISAVRRKETEQGVIGIAQNNKKTEASRSNG